MTAKTTTLQQAREKTNTLERRQLSQVAKSSRIYPPIMAKAKDLDAKRRKIFFGVGQPAHTVALIAGGVDGERVQQSTHTALDTISPNYYVRLPFRALCI